MDEIDVLNETEQLQTRRQVRSSTYEANLGSHPPDFPFEAFRAGLKAALMEDADLTSLGKTKDDDDEPHAPVIGIAVDGPLATDPKVTYRVRIDFGAGPIDRALVQEIINDNVQAELKLARNQS
jgi:hypothetical protein